jgi:hypothetical protein
MKVGTAALQHCSLLNVTIISNLVAGHVFDVNFINQLHQELIATMR